MRRGLLLISVALLLAGCGTGGKALSHGTDQTNGAKLFQAKCSGCHTLAAAGSSGTVGPNLDDAFRADKQQGFKESTIQNVVLLQIRQPSAPMPKNLVKGQDAQDVAAYVASVAGTASSSAPSPSSLGTDGKKIVQAECASCHTLKDAGITGTIGPNLDQIKPSEAIVQHQVTVGGGVMPAFKGKLSDAQITAVAKYVSAVAEVHTRTWQAAYEHVFGAEKLAAIDVSRRRSIAERSIAAGGVAVAEDDEGRVVGFVSVGPSRDVDGEGELYAIYVLPEAWGSGAGAALMDAGKELLGRSYADATLYVLEDNPRARRFYEREGWSADGVTKSDEFLGQPVPEVRYRIRLRG